jgi:glycosyltransferase involved in cell wall biosynthesis
MKVSVAMVTYRHERFIAQAIESVLAQRTDFDFELVIGEDCSPDGTREVAQKYAEKYPEKIRLKYPEKNIGLTRNLSQTIGACRGEYVAWLEGDDYWVSPDKLQRQADYLDQNPDCAWCFTRAVVVDAEGKPIDAGEAVRVVKPKYSLEDYLRRIFQPRACTVMFRHRLFERFPDWYFELPTGDMPLHVMNAQHGCIGFIDQVTSAYRIHPGGVWSLGIDPAKWTSSTPDQLRKQAARYEAMLHLYEVLAQYLGNSHRDVLQEQMRVFAGEWSRLNWEAGDKAALRRSALKSLSLEPTILHRIRPTLLARLAWTFLPDRAATPAE